METFIKNLFRVRTAGFMCLIGAFILVMHGMKEEAGTATVCGMICLWWD